MTMNHVLGEEIFFRTNGLIARGKIIRCGHYINEEGECVLYTVDKWPTLVNQDDIISKDKVNEAIEELRLKEIAQVNMKYDNLKR